MLATELAIRGGVLHEERVDRSVAGPVIGGHAVPTMSLIDVDFARLQTEQQYNVEEQRTKNRSQSTTYLPHVEESLLGMHISFGGNPTGRVHTCVSVYHSHLHQISLHEYPTNNQSEKVAPVAVEPSLLAQSTDSVMVSSHGLLSKLLATPVAAMALTLTGLESAPATHSWKST